MAIQPVYPLVNSYRHSFASIEALFLLTSLGQSAVTTAAGAQSGTQLNFRGFKGINYSRTRTRVEARGNHPDPLGKTRGSNAYKADVEILLQEFNYLQAQISNIQSAYGDVFFTFIVTYNEPGLDTIQDTIAGCTLDTTEAANAQNEDPTTRKIELNPLKIYYNNIDDTTPLQPLPTT